MIEIRMEHPAKNALGRDLIAWLTEQLERAGSEPLLLTGTGDAFCAGLNLREVASMDASAMERFLGELDDMVMRLYHHPAPTVAWINGHAIAGGAVLAQCCDQRVSTSNPRTRIGLNEVALGVIFPPAVRALLCERLSAPQAELTMLGAALYPPAEALRIGLVDEVHDDAEAVARARIEALAAHPADAYAATKRELRRARPDPDETRRFREEALAVWTSEDVRRRVLAVLEK